MDENKKQEIRDFLEDFSIDELKTVVTIAEEMMSDSALKDVDDVDTEDFDALSEACESLLSSLPHNTGHLMSYELDDIAKNIGTCYDRHETVRLSDVYWRINNYECTDEKRLEAMQILFGMLSEGVTDVLYD